MSRPGNGADGGPDAGAEAEVVGVRRGLFGASGSGDTSGYGGLVKEIVFPGPSSRPYGGYFDEVVDALTAALQRNGVDYADAVVPSAKRAST